MDCPVVSTKKGKVKGFVAQAKHKDAKPVYSFRNIPFGKSPVKKLRFMPPQPAESWSDVRDCTVPGPMPMQPRTFDEMMSKVIPMKLPIDPSKIETSEDCLHLSVYTPQMDKKLPVMVWLYGGGFVNGSELVYEGSALAGMNDVVVVVPNYRLNIFGFLSLGKNSICPGNGGMMDQVLALQWVRDNIGAFGGDEDNVTIFGESAGGVSVHHQIISPMSRGLFHKAISHSGQSIMPNMMISEEKISHNLKSLLEFLKIFEKEDQRILDALQEVSTEELINAVDTLSKKLIWFVPIVDGKFFVKPPAESLKDKDFAKVPYIVGFNDSEGDGLMIIMIGMGAVFKEGMKEEQAKTAIFIPKNDQLWEEWKKFYIKDEKDPTRFSKLYGKITGDGMFMEPAVSSAKIHAGEADTYMYVGGFQLRFNHDDSFGKDIMKKAEWCNCDHADDIQMVWGFPFTPGELPYGVRFSEEEKVLSQKIMTYLTNFAKTGNPNKGSKVDVEWSKYDCNGKYINFDHKLSMGEDYEPERVKFWAEKMPELMKKYPV